MILKKESVIQIGRYRLPVSVDSIFTEFNNSG